MAGNTKGLKAETPMNNVFDKFPDFIAGTLCWTPEDFKDGKDKYIVELTADEVHSVRRAIVFFKGTHTIVHLIRGLSLVSQRTWQNSPTLEPRDVPSAASTSQSSSANQHTAARWHRFRSLTRSRPEMLH